MDILSQKMRQACDLLEEMDTDLWMIYVRESSMNADPALALVVGDNFTWESFFLFERTGRTIALVGDLDRDIVSRHGRFTEVRTYSRGVRVDIRGLLTELKPRQILVNFSTGNPAADGLTYGMYLKLLSHVEGLPFANNLISSEVFLGRLRSRKTTLEIERLTAAATMAHTAWTEVSKAIRAGMTEIDIARLVDQTIVRLGGTPSFETIVNAGDKTRPGHGHPTNAVLERGDLLHVDFGVRYENYCSDIQRLLYIRRTGETAAPQELLDAFEMVSSIITRTGQVCVPGVGGHEVDALARQILGDNGYDLYQHGLGHQLGQAVHDGGAMLGPQWEQYGVAPTIPLEASNVFTLELEIMLPGIGCVGLEEDIAVTDMGARFLCPRQTELAIK
jgi:Xaa-Pro aminopeptidase